MKILKERKRRKGFQTLPKSKKLNFLLMWKRKRPKVQINGVVKVFKGTKEHKQTYYKLQNIERNA